MDPWAKKVVDLHIRCPQYRSIARRNIRGELLTYAEQQHIEHHVTAVLEATRKRTAAGDTTPSLSDAPPRGRQAG